MANPANIAVYDVNTIANYDPDIIPFLDAAVGSAFERPGGEFRRFRGTHGVVLPAGTLTRQWSWQGAAAAAICNPTELRLPPFALQLIARALG